MSRVILCPVGEILWPDRHADDDVHAAGHEAVDQREHEVRREERCRELAPAEALDPRVNILQKRMKNRRFEKKSSFKNEILEKHRFRILFKSKLLSPASEMSTRAGRAEIMTQRLDTASPSR